VAKLVKPNTTLVCRATLAMTVEVKKRDADFNRHPFLFSLISNKFYQDFFGLKDPPLPPDGLLSPKGLRSTDGLPPKGFLSPNGLRSRSPDEGLLSPKGVDLSLLSPLGAESLRSLKLDPDL